MPQKSKLEIASHIDKGKSQTVGLSFTNPETVTDLT